MGRLMDKMRLWLRDNRQITMEEYDDLVREYYDLRMSLIKKYRENRDMWYMEWRRLERENKPRPHSYEKFISLKMSELARKMTKQEKYRLNLDVQEHGNDGFYIYAKAKNWPDTMIGMVYYGG